MDKPPEYTVRDGIWDRVTKIGTIGRWRHTAIFPDSDGEESTITYCNNCGCPFTLGDDICADCGMNTKEQ